MSYKAAMGLECQIQSHFSESKMAESPFRRQETTAQRLRYFLGLKKKSMWVDTLWQGSSDMATIKYVWTLTLIILQQAFWLGNSGG